ncbi:MAG: PilZ domain-containing protein [Thermodesulfobacteriota bacterium]
MSGKEDIFKVYNEQDSHKAVSMFEKEILEQDATGENIRNRDYPRVDTFFKADFKDHPGHNGVLSGRATILNLSEGGMFADQVLAMDAKTKDVFIPKKIAGHELYDMKFRLNGNSDIIETKAECVREFMDKENLNAGIRFKSMKQEHKEMIKDYVQEFV